MKKYKYQGWKGGFVDAYFGHLEKGVWVDISIFKYWWLKSNGYIARKQLITTKLTDLIYISGDYSMFRSECWFSCGKNLKDAKRKLRKICSRHPYSQGSVIGTLTELKAHFRLNKTRTFYPYKIK